MRKREEFEFSLKELTLSKKSSTKGWRFIYDWLDSLVLAFIVILLVFTFAFRIVGVNGPSMQPTLHNGDWLALRSVNTSVQRGDIVVVTQPNTLNEPLIKRVIAVAGDTLDINFAEGTVSVNGEVLTEPYIQEPTYRMFDVAFPITVPEGKIFVMGDNRNDSLDSRSSTVGFIDKHYVLGVAQFRFYPFGEWKLDKNV